LPCSCSVDLDVIRMHLMWCGGGWVATPHALLRVLLVVVGWRCGVGCLQGWEGGVIRLVVWSGGVGLVVVVLVWLVSGGGAGGGVLEAGGL
jgi:hypothetical protein